MRRDRPQILPAGRGRSPPRRQPQDPRTARLAAQGRIQGTRAHDGRGGPQAGPKRKANRQKVGARPRGRTFPNVGARPRGRTFPNVGARPRGRILLALVQIPNQIIRPQGRAPTLHIVMIDLPDTPHRIYHGSNLRDHRRLEGRGLFFVTKCLLPRSPILISRSDDSPADIIVSAIIDEVKSSRLRLAAFCVMPDHWHALMAPNADESKEEVRPQGRAPTLGLGQTMLRLNTWISRQTNPMLRQHSCRWQKGYYETRIRTGRQFTFVCHYIEENPVRAGLKTDNAEWPWSSANPKYQKYLSRPWPTPFT